MGTAVVSGRVDQATKNRADRVIRASGLTTGDVIKALWAQISQTGEVPEFLATPHNEPDSSIRIARYMKFLDSLPPAPREYAEMSDDQMQELLGSRDA